MQQGIKNEYDFAHLIDKKKYKDLPINIQDLLLSIFQSINNNSVIECWCSKYYEKADIKIKIEGEIKGISIKTGHQCSMHQEIIKTFYNFLLKIGVKEKIIDNFNDYMNGKENNEKIDALTYIQKNEKSIKEIREELNKYYIKTNLIIRFIFQGNEKQNYGCDALIYGTPEKFLWATKDEILKFLIEYKLINAKNINVSALNIKNYDRNLRENNTNQKSKQQIQVKWYTLENDLKYITALRNANKYKRN